MLVFPSETAYTHLSGRFHDGHIQNLTADFSVRRFALLLGKINKGLIGNGLDKAIPQKAQRKAQRADRLGFRNAFLNFLVRKSLVGADGAIIHKRAAVDDLGSVGDRDVGSAKPPVRSQMANT